MEDLENYPNNKTQKAEIIKPNSVGDADLQLMISAGLTFLQQLPEIEQKKQESLIKCKQIDKEIQLDKFLHIEKADKNDKKYSIIITVLILVVIFIFKIYTIVGSEKLDMVFLLLVSFIFSNSGKIWKTFSKNNDTSNNE
jgi:hypothetical protein